MATCLLPGRASPAPDREMFRLLLRPNETRSVYVRDKRPTSVARASGYSFFAGTTRLSAPDYSLLVALEHISTAGFRSMPPWAGTRTRFTPQPCWPHTGSSGPDRTPGAQHQAEARIPRTMYGIQHPQNCFRYRMTSANLWVMWSRYSGSIGELGAWAARRTRRVQARTATKYQLQVPRPGTALRGAPPPLGSPEPPARWQCLSPDGEGFEGRPRLEPYR
ncbi:hypothetical protein QFZ30_002092 [Arthrobacter pascens]|nr:hypothetical protein [Arthrobacter pascens]